MLMPGIGVRQSPGRGRGLFTTVAIPRGQVVWHPCTKCEIYPPGGLSRDRAEEIEELGYYLYEGSQILPCRNACLLNHSCEAPVLDFGLDFGLAVRDIEAGEEITIDYRTFRHEPPWVVQCNCPSRHCAGAISPSPGQIADEVAARWVERMEPALAALPKVPQPLDDTLRESSILYPVLRVAAPTAESAWPQASISEPAFFAPAPSLQQLSMTTR